MGYKYNFQHIKETVSVEQAVVYLGLKPLKKDTNGWRAPCPHSNSKNGIALNIETNAFFCHSCETGGSVIDLVSHVRKIGTYDAAKFLQDRSANAEEEETVPQKKPEKGKKPVAKSADFQPLSSNEVVEKAIESLIHEHPKVQALGISAEDAERLDIGFKARGLYKGRVCEPSRTREGHPVCLKPLPEDFQFPKVLHWPTSDPPSNVVPLKRA